MAGQGIRESLEDGSKKELERLRKEHWRWTRVLARALKIVRMFVEALEMGQGAR